MKVSVHEPPTLIVISINIPPFTSHLYLVLLVLIIMGILSANSCTPNVSTTTLPEDTLNHSIDSTNTGTEHVILAVSPTENNLFAMI